MNPTRTFQVKFSTRGRVTIPAAVRQKFGMSGGSKMSFEITPAGGLLLKPVGKSAEGARRLGGSRGR
jgi:AbrB family looped-hinge helix DNA binding protein